MNRHYFYDFTDIFKNGGVPEVQILHWYVDGNHRPMAVIEVIKATVGTFPTGGEILKVGLGREFSSLSHERYMEVVRDEDWEGDDDDE